MPEISGLGRRWCGVYYLKASPKKPSKSSGVVKKPLVVGEVRFPEDARPFSGATVYIRLENTSRQDAGSQIVAEQVVQDFSYKGSKTKLQFELYGEPPDPRASYNVRVHVDVDRDKQISTGDYITTESYPVLTYGYPRRVYLLVREVT
jgi:uncharacterized lipoprotein YbaY